MKKLVSVLLLFFLAFSCLSADDAAAERPKVALVLSGGGAKGIAHIPIIEALERYGIPIDKVYGTSMGALIGGLYSAGLSPGEMREIVTGTDLTQLFTVFESEGYTEVLDAFEFNSNNVLSLSLGQGIGGTNGFIDDYLVLNFFNSHIGNVPEYLNFDTDLVVPFECNATDMLTGDEVVFTEGSLITAMRSSMSIPLVFEPVMLDDGSVFMDGGVVCNYIVHRAVEEGYDIIIVVTLDGYGKVKLSAENYSSLSGAASSTLQTVLRNVSKGEVDMADYWFSPDTTQFGTLGFGDAVEILEKGDQEVEEQKAKLEEIASLFTEDQKQYKDPERIGEYHTKFPERPKENHKSSRERRHEDLMGRTRVSLGLYGYGGYGFFFDKKEYEDNRTTMRTLYPTLSVRAFLKDLNGSRFSFDISFKLSMNRTTDLSILNLYRFTADRGERLFGIARVRTGIGSLTFITDKNEPDRQNRLEGLVGLDLGLLLSNERNHLIKLYASVDNNWTVSFTHLKSPYSFSPSAALEMVFFPNYRNGIFKKEGTRVDILARGGYNVNEKEWFYNLGLSGNFNFRLSEKMSLWADANVYAGRGSSFLRSTFSEYGGWNGMPGFAPGSRFLEFIHGGVGIQFALKSGMVSNYLALVVRAGVRSNALYGYYGYLNTGYDSMVPFSNLEFREWDIGASVGYGISSPVGDLVFGAGFNNHLQLALYVELT